MKKGVRISDLLSRSNVLATVAKSVVFCALGLIGIIVIGNSTGTVYAGIPAWYIVLPAVVLLLAENAVKMWALKTMKQKAFFYALDIFLLLLITISTDGALISTFYIIILSEFYIWQESLPGNIAMGASSIGVYLITLIVSGTLRGDTFNIVTLLSAAFNDLVLLVLHFFIVNFTIQIYRKNREIAKAYEELSETNKELQRLSEEHRALAVLEERQRIAKDIHDTAGHSITTVIMQTEAARPVIDRDPEDAKRKIAAANLQAKHALDELRESVHLLSGSTAGMTLRESLLSIVQESTEGTGIAVRSLVDDVELSDAKRRFVCNTLKEGISNGLRHGGATAFFFELKKLDGKIEFLLSDNGCGMDPREFKEGFGLSGMHARAEALGGDIHFETEVGEGFEIRLTLPIEDMR